MTNDFVKVGNSEYPRMDVLEGLHSLPTSSHKGREVISADFSKVAMRKSWGNDSTQ
jgi:hypothetical protein